MSYLPKQKPSLSSDDAIRSAQRSTQQSGVSGTFPLAPLTNKGQQGYLTFNQEGRLIDARPAT